MGRVVRWVLAVGAMAGLAVLCLHKMMKADAAVAKEEKLLRKVAAGEVTKMIDEVEAEIKVVAKRALAAEVEAAEASDRFDDAVARARRLWAGQNATTGE